ncbi:helix-turn-helix domain-containing protein [Caulobacter segnis]|uniref:helix-turn-helix domain-containing protein n=1 Tax=Caulobacter segnis TaxID=88688 RepID=UPI0024107E77|nr:helix-turn-helix domain-containing protein [Caulobacter segnis]MDG2521825.1 helix-turn-helix domain-containing protein [Caulobacter segnis]
MTRPWLRAVPMFAPLDAEVLAALEAAGETRTFGKNHLVDIHCEDDLIVLLSGAVALSVAEAGRQAVLSTISGASALNLACAMTKARCEVRWRTLGPCAVFILPGHLFREALAADAGFAARAYEALAVAYHQLLSTAADQRLRSAQGRVVSYLLSLIPASSGGARVRLPYEKGLVASLLGMTPENLSRALGRLTSHGVSIRGASVIVEEVARLQTLQDAETGPRRGMRASATEETNCKA